jgi:hypothetical protein
MQLPRFDGINGCFPALPEKEVRRAGLMQPLRRLGVEDESSTSACPVRARVDLAYRRCTGTSEWIVGDEVNSHRNILS